MFSRISAVCEMNEVVCHYSKLIALVYGLVIFCLLFC